MLRQCGLRLQYFTSSLFRRLPCHALVAIGECFAKWGGVIVALMRAVNLNYSKSISGKFQLRALQ